MFSDIKDIYLSATSIRKENKKIAILDKHKVRDILIDRLVLNAVFNENAKIMAESRWLIKTIAKEFQIYPASIQGLYDALGRGDVSGFVVPAINIRGITYDFARAIFRAAIEKDVGAFILEIARSEIGYTSQSPSEYSSAVLAAAVKEGYAGPVFIQGDHFQLKSRGFAEDGEREVGSLKNLIRDSIGASFYNIDIDASTLVDLSKGAVIEQQRPNYEVTAEITAFIRDIEPRGLTVSIGGEIGEVGGKNSTEEDLRTFMKGYSAALAEGLRGISKISVQTGTSHGGVVLPDGSVAKVKVDFDTIKDLSTIARESYHLAGVVQHGASTLPDNAFGIFVGKGAAEIHLATGFQNMIYDSIYFPEDLRQEIYQYIRDNFSEERVKDMTEEQFIYKTRKKAFGPFKSQMWRLPSEVKMQIGEQLRNRFLFLFDSLNVFGTRGVVSEFVTPHELYYSIDEELSNL